MKKILIIRFSSIGDIVLTTPVARCLKVQLNAEVHYLTKKGFRQVLEANPYIHKIHTIEKRVGEVLADLKKEGFDYIIDLHRNLRSAQVKLLLRKPSRSFDKLNWEKWLMVRFKLNRLPAVHIVDRYLATVRHLGVVNDGKGLDYFIPTVQEVNPATLLGDAPKPYIAFVIGAAHATKRLPAPKIIAICQKIKHPIILLGGPEEAEIGQAIADAAGPHTINSCGQLRLHQSASIVRQAWKVITHDTGLMHIAAAFQKEIISVWGNTIPEFGMAPYYSEGVNLNTSLQVQGLSCRPCSKIGHQTCPQGHFKCMLDQAETFAEQL
ncbi:MAG: glycosyltransferase family 9 protein [Saprospiraceae bacterium]